MKNKLLFTITFLFAFSLIYSQSEPQDYLSSEFHKDRRDNVRNLMPKNSVAVFFANPVRNRANDVDYHYHQDPNFYYLTGFREPNSVLLIFSEDQNNADDIFNELIFVQERDKLREMWNGKRLGPEGVKSKLGFKLAYTADKLTEIAPNFSTFDSVLFFDFKNDVRDNKGNVNDLFSLIEKFKIMSNYPIDFNPEKEKFYDVISLAPNENSANVAQVLKSNLRNRPSLKDDKLLNEFQSASSQETLLEIKQKITLRAAESNLDAIALSEIMRQLREIKTEEELVLMSKAAKISAIGQVEVMKAMNPSLSEMEIQGIHEFVYKKYNVEYEGYPSIVGGGHNGCILHYIENTKLNVGNDLVLMDLGAEYHGYTADVTRTIPANGYFSKEQKAIYDIVYEAQEAGIKAAVVGADFRAPHNAAVEVIKQGLIDLGIISDPKDYRNFFPHGTSHYVGLDVHDPGTTGPYRANSIITVEPGIYVQDKSDCDPKWWGIAVRIEDTILITENGPLNLSIDAPRKSDEIEKIMKKSSPLANFILPKI
ncbi:aminopeptidase P N-terminal domain-containing protein [Flavobacteriaceae bacterium]|jgi:Xaa-Pro aminopeptidase|nr:aminopeptidase P N-terminal domain-containing protein [Flavobacteriaceae bacterium]